ncbi:restriction endonuclease subunit S [Yinghuangia seranimata]|nr:restriction endonuclease subunit S [Yinghuangia seranimata]MDI2125091.1 restriction endonuclease subunit S [Yinghuangia seranimata]
MNLPPSWASAPLKHLTTHLNRGSAPTYADAGPVRAISQAANQETGLEWERTRYHDHRGPLSRLKGLLYPRDILVNSTGTGTLGRVGYFSSPPDKIPCMADSHVTVVRTNPNVLDSRYCYYWLSCHPFQVYTLSALAVGATNQIELNRDRLGDAPVPVPPLDEQRRIGDFLDTETARIDRINSRRATQAKLLEERAYAVVSDALIPGILTSPRQIGPWPWLPQMDVGRPLVRLGYVCRLQNGLTVDSGRDLSGDVVSLPYLRVANVQAGRLELDSVKEITVRRSTAERSMLRAGDVLMTEGGDLDKLGRGTVWHGELASCLHQNHIFALRPEAERLDAEYLALMTQTVHGRCYFESTGTRTTNLASTNSSKIMSFPIPLPRITEQRRMVSQAQTSLDRIRRLRDLLGQQTSLLAESRQALITAAVTGQFDVSTASGRGVVS